jgi:hypothetical protein
MVILKAVTSRRAISQYKTGKLLALNRNAATPPRIRSGLELP